jgi:hypothetical protein
MCESLSHYGKFEIDTWVKSQGGEDLEEYVKILHHAIEKSVQNQDLLVPWSLYLLRRRDAAELSLTNFVELLEKKCISPDELTCAYAYCFYSTIIRESFRNIPELARFTGLKTGSIYWAQAQSNPRRVQAVGQGNHSGAGEGHRP